jgi:hypothetical protein
MTKTETRTRQDEKRGFDPHRLVTDEQYGANLNALIAYYQMVKGEARKRVSRVKAA